MVLVVLGVFGDVLVSLVMVVSLWLWCCGRVGLMCVVVVVGLDFGYLFLVIVLC